MAYTVMDHPSARQVSEYDAAVGRRVYDAIYSARIPQSVVYEAMGLSRGSLAKKLRGEVRWSAR